MTLGSFPFGAVFYAHALYTWWARSCMRRPLPALHKTVMCSLVALYGYACWGIESSCTMKKTVVDIKVTRLGGVYYEGDAGFFFPKKKEKNNCVYMYFTSWLLMIITERLQVWHQHKLFAIQGQLNTQTITYRDLFRKIYDSCSSNYCPFYL